MVFHLGKYGYWMWFVKECIQSLIVLLSKECLLAFGAKCLTKGQVKDFHQTNWFSFAFPYFSANNLTPTCVDKISRTLWPQASDTFVQTIILLHVSQIKWKINKMKQSRKLQSLFHMGLQTTHLNNTYLFS